MGKGGGVLQSVPKRPRHARLFRQLVQIAAPLRLERRIADKHFFAVVLPEVGLLFIHVRRGLATHDEHVPIALGGLGLLRAVVNEAAVLADGRRALLRGHEEPQELP